MDHMCLNVRPHYADWQRHTSAEVTAGFVIRPNTLPILTRALAVYIKTD